MAEDLFEQLINSDVPPVPPQLDAKVHERLNAALLRQHLFDFTWGALPQTLAALLGSIVHLLNFTLTGRLNENLDGRPAEEQ